MKRKGKYLAGVMLATALLVGCSQDEGEIKDVTLTAEEQDQFIGQFLEKTSDPTTEPSKMVEELNQNIEGLDGKKASDSIDALLFMIYQHRDQMNSVVSGYTPIIDSYVADGLDMNSKEDIAKIDDKGLKAFMEQVKSRYLIVEKENEQYVLVADFEQVLVMYEDYINEDLKAMIKFSKEEFEVKYFDEEKQQMKFDLIAERIVLMEKLEKKFPESYYASWFSQSKYFYYQLYFGMNGNAITDKNQTLLPEVNANIQEMLKKYEGTNFATNITSFLTEYEKNGNKLNDSVYVFLLDLTQKEHQTISEDETAQEGTGNSQVKDAIKEALEESKTEETK